MVNDLIYLNTNKLLMNNRNWNFTIIQLCEELGISIPRFCYHRELSIVGNCRMCMVELKTSIKPVIACATSLNKNMQIFTNSELVKIARGNVLEFLLINHPLDCPICDQGGECDLQDQAFLYGSDKSRFSEYKRSVEDKNFGPVIKTVMSRCIHCTRCVRYAEEILGVFTIGTMGRGKETEISTYNNSILQHEMIGNIADICPVGALLIKPTAFRARTWDLENLDLLDIFDSMVSTAVMGIKGNELFRVLPKKNDNLNREWITDKIRFFYEGIKLNRLLFPLINNSDKIIHCSLNFVCDFYVKKLYESYSHRNSIVGFIGEELDYYDSFLISHFTNNLNIFCSYGESKKKHLNVDSRSNWLLNNNISNFVKQPNLLFLNVNLKYECAIINSLLYQATNMIEHQNIYYIGVNFKNSFNINHIGINSNSLKSIRNGKHYFCFNLLNNTINWIESGTQPILEYSVEVYLNNLSVYTKKQNNSYIASSSTELNIWETGVLSNGVVYENTKEKKFSLAHFFGYSEFRNLNKNVFSVYFSHHMPTDSAINYNIYLPILNYHEWSSNTNGPKTKMWLNNQLISQILFDCIITDAGQPESYFSYLNLFLYFIDKKYIKSDKLLNTFINLVDSYFFNIEYNSKYLNYYSNNLILNNNVITFFNNINSKEQSPKVYYKSSAYIRNSVTLSATYEYYNNVLRNIINGNEK